MTEYQKIELYPTSVIRFTLHNKFEGTEITAMISDVDEICSRSDLMIDTQNHPQFQCLPFLFNQNNQYGQKSHWLKLKKNFEDCCAGYLELNMNFCSLRSTDLKITHSRAWFYKSNKRLSESKTLPIHNHYYSFLSGIFYLRVPVGTESNGTEFYDPRGPAERLKVSSQLPAQELSWLIFPGWLDHKPIDITSEEFRYTVAADLYVAPSV